MLYAMENKIRLNPSDDSAWITKPIKGLPLVQSKRKLDFAQIIVQIDWSSSYEQEGGSYKNCLEPAAPLFSF
jgi:hypothetical protein